MGRDTYYFPHDYNARGDERIVALLMKRGWEGYGLYWAVVEKLYEAGGRLLPAYDSLGYELRVEPDCVKSLVEGFDLFYMKDGKFGSTSVDRRLEERRQKSEKARKSAERRDYANAMRTHSERNANAMLERKGKERKETVPDSELNAKFDHRCNWDEAKPTWCVDEAEPCADKCRYHIQCCQAIASGKPIPDRPKPELPRLPHKKVCIDCKTKPPYSGELYCRPCIEARV